MKALSVLNSLRQSMKMARVSAENARTQLDTEFHAGRESAFQDAIAMLGVVDEWDTPKPK